MYMLCQIVDSSTECQGIYSIKIEAMGFCDGIRLQAKFESRACKLYPTPFSGEFAYSNYDKTVKHYLAGKPEIGWIHPAILATELFKLYEHQYEMPFKLHILM